MMKRLIELLSTAPADFNGNRNVRTLADYLLANGVIVPPCKVGDTVYWYDSEIHENPGPVRVKEIVCYSNNDLWVGCNNNRYFRASSFGKTVFLTREAAEQAFKGGAE